MLRATSEPEILIRQREGKAMIVMVKIGGMSLGCVNFYGVARQL
jgi:hypothetical protein